MVLTIFLSAAGCANQKAGNADVVKYLISKGTDLKFGARPLSRAIQKHLMDGLSVELLADRIVEGDNVLATFDNENEKVLFEVLNHSEVEEQEEANSLVD